ncbi:hypothetical protein Efla_005346 [Eimeria flavescens]
MRIDAIWRDPTWSAETIRSRGYCCSSLKRRGKYSRLLAARSAFPILLEGRRRQEETVGGEDDPEGPAADARLRQRLTSCTELQHQQKKRVKTGNLLSCCCIPLRGREREAFRGSSSSSDKTHHKSKEILWAGLGAAAAAAAAAAVIEAPSVYCWRSAPVQQQKVQACCCSQEQQQQQEHHQQQHQQKQQQEQRQQEQQQQQQQQQEAEAVGIRASVWGHPVMAAPATAAPPTSGGPKATSSTSTSSSSRSSMREKRSWDPLDYEGPLRSLPQLCQVSVRRTRELFASNEGFRAPPFAPAVELALKIKLKDEYDFSNRLAAAATAAAAAGKGSRPEALTQGSSKLAVTDAAATQPPAAAPAAAAAAGVAATTASTAPAAAATASAPSAGAAAAGGAAAGKLSVPQGASLSEMIQALSPYAGAAPSGVSAAAAGAAAGAAAAAGGGSGPATTVSVGSSGIGGELSNLRLRQILEPMKPQWHPPWQLQRVISGHLGWVNCVSVDPTNNFFATGSNDRLLKIWDLATGQLKLSLTGHVSSLKDVQISDRHPYLFSCGEDGRVKCWDLEQNRVVRDYHGHLSGVYTLALHPSLDILCSGGRDAVVRVWDMRTKQSIFVFAGHSGTIMKLQMQTLMPHIVSGSQDKMVRLWDLSAGKCQATLTNHKKSIRTLSLHPTEYTFATCGADKIKVWRCPLGAFERNIEGVNSIPNCCAIRAEDGNKASLVVGSNNGQLHFFDWASGYKYQTVQSRVQPGSLESENGIFCCAFDKSETRLITGECDKTIKIWKINEEATEETHPIVWRRHGRQH